MCVIQFVNLKVHRHLGKLFNIISRNSSSLDRGRNLCLCNLEDLLNKFLFFKPALMLEVYLALRKLSIKTDKL